MSFNSAVEIMNRIYFQITVLPCPIGFSISNDSSASCDCAFLLLNHGFKCNIHNQSVSWSSGTKWIGIFSNNTIGIIDDCPTEYFNDLTSVSLSSPDILCKYNRSNVLCGQCQGRQSMMLGSPQCNSNCSNYYLLLLIPFALMGVALVAFLLAFNFTVSSGTINSLILYAFVIRLNENKLFPLSCNALGKYLLSPFIAWLNLDLGIETCFYEKMESTGKVWLQFVFSVYVAVIIGAIIMGGKVSSKVSRMCRYRLFPVIATLCLLFYSKMLRTVLIIFSYSPMDTSDGITLFVWAYDGNVTFLSPRHIGLFIIGLLVTIFFLVPYSLLIPMTPYIVKLSHWKVFSLINTVKPLVDSYEAPFKDRYRFWTALDKKMALLRLNAMRKFIANVKHHIYARIYTDVNIITFYANIYNTFTAYVKVQTYLHTYLRHVCRASKCGIYLRTYLPYVCSY